MSAQRPYEGFENWGELLGAVDANRDYFADPLFAEQYLRSEARADEIRSVNDSLFPGLLQTEAFAAAILHHYEMIKTDPRPDKEHLALQVRMGRRALTAANRIPMRFLVSQEALDHSEGIVPDSVRAENLRDVVRRVRDSGGRLRVGIIAAGQSRGLPVGARGLALTYHRNEGTPPDDPEEFVSVEGRKGQIAVGQDEALRLFTEAEEAARRLAHGKDESLDLMWEMAADLSRRR